MDSPKIDIDDVIAHKLTAQQVKAAFLVAYGKYPQVKIAELCGITLPTIKKWTQHKYFQLLVRHVRCIELYHNLDEYTALRKASIASVGKLLEKNLIGDDIKELSKHLDTVFKLLNVSR